jgi:NAD-dependent DNA ligase
MGSLEKVGPEDTARMSRFVARYAGPYVVSDKLDGVAALVWTEVNGNARMATRGDGTTGRDITWLLQYIHGVPEHIDGKKIMKLVKTGTNSRPGCLMVRGELVISKRTFEGLDRYRGHNPRNTVAGVVNSKNKNEETARDIEFVAHELVGEGLGGGTRELAILKSAGYSVVHAEAFKELNMTRLGQTLDRRRNEGKFEMDGLVVRGAAREGGASGNTGRTPEDAFAFKDRMSLDTADVVVTRVTWTASKDAYLVPVVEFAGVHLGGVEIRRATGFNAAFIRDRRIGPGATIRIVRSGDVIPHILDVVIEAEPQMPEQDYEWTEKGKNVRLRVRDSQADVRQAEHFFKGIGVKGLRERTLEKWASAGYDTVVKMVHGAQGTNTTLVRPPLLVEAIHSALAAVDEVTLMASSNIFGRGFGRARLSAMLEKGSETWPMEFEKGMKEFQGFKRDLQWQPQTMTRVAHEAAFKVVFSGFRDSELERRVEMYGGEVTNGIAKDSSMLVVHHSKPGQGESTKEAKAKAMGIQVVDRIQFETMLPTLTRAGQRSK